MASYVALLRKEKKSDYSVCFPDFPGCITAGKTLDEAYRLASEALAFHIEGMEEDGETIPAPTSLEIIASSPEHRGTVATLVPVTPRSRVQRLNITMDAETLQRVDAYAERVGMSRSAFLAHAANAMLGTTRARQTRRLRDVVKNGTAARRKARRAKRAK